MSVRIDSPHRVEEGGGEKKGYSGEETDERSGKKEDDQRCDTWRTRKRVAI
jgi:hypothetical protein